MSLKCLDFLCKKEKLLFFSNSPALAPGVFWGAFMSVCRMDFNRFFYLFCLYTFVLITWRNCKLPLTYFVGGIVERYSLFFVNIFLFDVFFFGKQLTLFLDCVLKSKESDEKINK